MVGDGDETAYSALYGLVFGRVHARVQRVVRDPTLSEDVAQDVLVEVWRKAPAFDAAQCSGLGWVLMLAHRRAVDQVRSEQRARNRMVRLEVLGAGQGGDPVAEAVQTSYEHEQVGAALAGLTALQRQTVALIFYDGYTRRQAAELLDTPLPTIKTRLRDALLRLRSCLQSEDA